MIVASNPVLAVLLTTDVGQHLEDSPDMWTVQEHASVYTRLTCASAKLGVVVYRNDEGQAASFYPLEESRNAAV